MSAAFASIRCPALLFWGRESFAVDPELAPEAAALRDLQIVKVDRAGHWVHHDQLEVFLYETRKFLEGRMKGV
jgi:pimeloyl-ACP methyl ester carboxylesterase